jgi:methyltransferase-like protein/ubiquinone/menaquinone biosynthesis C-methylase UbiE
MANRYDEVPYPGRVFPATHPGHLAVIATLFGMTPAPAEGCRVLELGCGDGGNLIPMAYGLPGSEFVGVDLARQPIRKGREAIARLGLRNIELLEADLAAFDPPGAPFDYIIGHGIYSWVPEPVRQSIWRILSRRLAPQGVAYISYNARPGGLLREVMRQILLFHVRDIAAPAEQIAEARRMADYIAQSEQAPEGFRALMAQEAKEVRERSDAALYHDYLAPESEPLWLHEFVARAEANGLQYLGDADLHLMFAGVAPKSSAGGPRFAGLEENFVLREQYADILLGRRFRRSLLCRAGLTLDRRLDPNRVRRFEISSPLVPAVAQPSLDASAKIQFCSPQAGTITTNFPLGKAALMELSELWPDSIPFEGLAERTARRLQGRLSEDDRRDLAQFLFRLVLANMVELHLHRFAFSAEPGERPLASPVARLAAETQSTVANLRHRAIELATPGARELLLLLDGTRDRATLARELNVPLELVESGLRDLARMAMLVH